MYGIAADQGGAHEADFRKTAKDEGKKQIEVRKRAADDEADRDRLLRESAAHEHRHHWLTGAATLIEIGIALSTVAIITRRRPFWYGALALGLVGVALAGIAFA
jgi:hypothetical protein